MLYTINDSEEITNLVEGLVINDGNKTISKKRSHDSVFRNNVYNSYIILTSLDIILRTNHFIKIICNWRVNIPRDTWYRKFECGEVLFFY
jgi:hypothetical protein